MIERYIELYEMINGVILKLQMDSKSTRADPPPIVTGRERHILIEVRDLLRPLEEATRAVSQEKLATISICIPIIYGLRQEVTAYQPETGLGFNVQQTILTEIDKKLGSIEKSPIHAAATILDPRFRKSVFNLRAASDTIGTITIFLLHHITVIIFFLLFFINEMNIYLSIYSWPQ